MKKGYKYPTPRSAEWCHNLSKPRSEEYRHRLSDAKRIAELDVETVSYLYHIEKLSMYDIAKLYETYPNSVFTFMKRHNIARRPMGETMRLNKVTKYNWGKRWIANRDLAYTDIAHLYQDEGHTIGQVAKLLNSTHEVVSRLMDDWGIPKRSRAEEMLGTRNGFYGKKHTTETKQRISGNKERAAKIGRAQRGSIRPCSAENGRRGAPKISAIRKREWKNPEYAKKMLAAMRVKPTKPERIVEGLLTELCPGEYRYTGAGGICIDGLIPDFANCNGQKKVIEVFGVIFHDPNKSAFGPVKLRRTAEGRSAVFKSFGFESLIIWDYELKDIAAVKARILEFHKCGKQP